MPPLFCSTPSAALLVLAHCCLCCPAAASPPLVAGALLTAAPCDAASALQRIVVHAADNTVRSLDGTLCVTYTAPSPAQLSMQPCGGGGSGTQTWSFVADKSFQGKTSDGSCVAWNSQGDPGSPTRTLSTWRCDDVEWNGEFFPLPASIVANCTAPGACGALLCVSASPVCAPHQPCVNATYVVSDARGPSRAFDGVGGLSGGGAVSRLLPSYDAATRSQILDFLFLPGYGAALQVLKVEIGSDCQSTDGSEATHRRSWDAAEDSFERGFEWGIMREAKARNPSIRLYGLAWGWPWYLTCAPGTLSNCTGDVYSNRSATVDYIVSWVRGARDVHGLIIDFVSSTPITLVPQ